MPEASRQDCGISDAKEAPSSPAEAGSVAVPLLSMALLALSGRAFAALNTRVITPDGVEFISIAREFASGDFAAALAHRQHPLYPAFVAVASLASGDFGFAAPAVAVLMGSLTVIPLIALLRRPFGTGPALFAGFLFSMLPAFVKSGADALSDTTFHFFAIAALWAGYGAIAPGKAGRARWIIGAACGLLCAAAYYARPEGLLIPVCLCVSVAFTAAGGSARLIRAAGPAALAFTVFLTAIFPYLLHVRECTGAWDLTKKKPAANLLNVYQGEQGEASESAERTDLPRSSSIPGAAWLVAKAITHNYFYLPVALVVVGMAVRRRRFMDFEEAFFLIPALVWLAVCFLLARSHGYVSHRHAAPAALVLLGFAGRGGVAVAAAAARAEFGPLSRLPTGKRRAMFSVALALLIAVAGSTTAFRASRSGKVWVKEIGAELKAMGAGGTVALGNRIRVSYYAGARHVDIPAMASWETVVRTIEDSGAEFLVIDLLDPHFPVRYKPVLDRFAGGAAPVGFSLLREWKIDGSSGRERDVRAFRIDRGALFSKDRARDEASR